MSDTFCVSGGGVRSALVGLVALHELANPVANPKKRSADEPLEIPPSITYGLSGGAWCVLANEVVGAQKALENASRYIDSMKHGLGQTFGLDVEIHLASNWKMYPYWKNYVTNFLLAMLVDHTVEKPPYSADDDSDVAQKAREEFLLSRVSLDQTAASSNIVIGLSNTAAGTENMLVCPSPSQGRILGASSLIALSQPPVLKYTLTTGFVFHDTKEEHLHMTRLHQATISSVAYVAIGTEVREYLPALAALLNHKGIRGLSGALVLAGHQFPATHEPEDDAALAAAGPTLDVELFDMGIRCNIPVTPDQLRSPGTSLVVDASNDAPGVLFESMGTAVDWWMKQYHFIVKQAESPSDIATLSWRGVPVTIPSTSNVLRQYVRVYKVYDEYMKPTGRTIICITMGRIAADGTIVPAEERLVPLTTIVGGQPRVFSRAEFDLINTEVRQFFSAVFNALGLSGGKADTQ